MERQLRHRRHHRVRHGREQRWVEVRERGAGVGQLGEAELRGHGRLAAAEARGAQRQLVQEHEAAPEDEAGDGPAWALCLATAPAPPGARGRRRGRGASSGATKMDDARGLVATWRAAVARNMNAKRRRTRRPAVGPPPAAVAWPQHPSATVAWPHQMLVLTWRVLDGWCATAVD